MVILTPLLSKSTSTTSAETDDSPSNSQRFIPYKIPYIPKHGYLSLAVLSGHLGSVSSLALCGEFILSASQGKDIIVWQQPDLRLFTRFGQGDGSVKALVTVGNKVFTAHQDSRILVWKVSRRSENVFRLVDTMPTTKDYLGKFMKQSNYVQTRRHHRRLWIEHADSISCLAVHNGLIYSGSWDKTLKVWRISDLKCLESIQAHDDAINAVVPSKEIVYTASADGKIKVWRKSWSGKHILRETLGSNHGEVSINAVVASDDGRVVYGGGSAGYVTGWYEGSDSWKIMCQIKAHKMAVLCMCLVGEGFLCTGSADKLIGIWKREISGVITGIGVIRGHEGPVKCLQPSSPNSVGSGFLLYSGSLDKSVRVWWIPKNSTEDTFAMESTGKETD